MKIVIDAFGGDNSPDQVIAGTLLALNENKDFVAVLCGDEKIINDKLNGKSYDKERIEILDAKSVITCEEEPTVAVRNKADSSICVSFKALKENGEYNAFVSAGSTGAVLVGATLRLGRISGVLRPALCPILPTVKKDKKVFLLDSGANADCKSVNLCQFAVMGSAYAESLGVKNPKVALLSNGTEDEKGNLLCHETFEMLKNTTGINFVGNIEGRDILSGEVDVVVCDGFSGNIALKSLEVAVTTLFSILKEEIYYTVKGKIGGLFLKKTFKGLKARLDYSATGGALFLGVAKPVIKAHGSSNAVAFKNAILQAVSYAENDLADKVKDKLASAVIPTVEG